ncbi:DUF3105 domain-containing protein [Georgenia muralis]|uniref:Uncharacterized protein DUF3105 n=1 Tax=Georgenia muralis TaxID=154117 RepID=A0A3N4Z7R7_9MICO|nr:DUF3105 domain-containing protein [Georgenia muralis]RPF28014.1 uncharacterized protein DUF3105 [Georgenia muralis]
MTKNKQAQARAAQVAAMRAEQARKDRRHRNLIIAAVSLICVGLIAAVAIPLAGASRQRAAVEAAASAPIDGVEEFADLSANHVTGNVDYPMAPAAGGDHDQAWQNCGVYTEPVPDENAVHSLEHGAVWIAYSPDLPADQADALTGKAENQPYVLVSPYENTDSPIVLSAWGLQLAVKDADDPRIDTFLARHLQGEQTPEPGAACFSGVGTPAV